MPRYDGPIVDIDVHHGHNPKELLEYISPLWRDEYLLASGQQMRMMPAAPSAYPLGGTNKRLDAYPPTGGHPGWDYETLKTQLLERADDYRAILSYDIGGETGLPNPYLAVEVCRSMNDWCIDRWLGLDERLYGAILTVAQLPEEGAKEIRRLAGHPKMAEVLMVVGNGRPFGHPLYDPIYQAAQEVGLPVSIHAGNEFYDQGMSTTAAGMPQSRLETFVSSVPAAGMHQAASFIEHATFERFPGLRVLITESGFSWVPSLLWKLDRNYRLLKRENPRVNELPSETFRRHLKVTSQPFDYADRNRFLSMLEGFDGMREVMCYASDYPHWDSDAPNHVAALIPESWWPQVFAENGASLFGWKLTAPVG